MKFAKSNLLRNELEAMKEVVSAFHIPILQAATKTGWRQFGIKRDADIQFIMKNDATVITAQQELYSDIDPFEVPDDFEVLEGEVKSLLSQFEQAELEHKKLVEGFQYVSAARDFAKSKGFFMGALLDKGLIERMAQPGNVFYRDLVLSLILGIRMLFVSEALEALRKQRLKLLPAWLKTCEKWESTQLTTEIRQLHEQIRHFSKKSPVTVRFEKHGFYDISHPHNFEKSFLDDLVAHLESISHKKGSVEYARTLSKEGIDKATEKEVALKGFAAAVGPAKKESKTEEELRNERIERILSEVNSKMALTKKRDELKREYPKEMHADIDRLFRQAMEDLN